MPRRKLSRGTKKFIRKEKARIRREFSNADEQKSLIGELYQNPLPKHKDAGKVKHHEPR